MPKAVVAPMPVLKQLEAIFDRDANADCVALVWPEPLVPPMLTVDVKGKPVQLVHCPSELAMREALVNKQGSECLVLLSKFDEIHLAKDVLARLWGNEPKRISPWKTLQQLIKVRDIDPRLTRPSGRWMAEALLASFDRYQNKITFGEVLDLDNAWRALTLGYLKYEESELDILSLFKWSIHEDVTKLLENTPSEVKNNLSDWLNQHIPNVSTLIECLLQEGHANDLLAIGLACSVMFDKELASKQIIDNQLLYSGRGRFNERFLSDVTIDTKELAYFGDESVKVALLMVREGGYKLLSPSLNKAEQILASLDFMSAVELSPVLPASFNKLLTDYAQQLEFALKNNNLANSVEALNVLQKHALSSLPANLEQLNRANMALRLIRWLIQEAKDLVPISELIGDYIKHGSFVDWARSRIWSGDVHESLSHIYQKLSDAVTLKREQQNKRFSEQLHKVARGDKIDPDFIPVESTLEQLVAPIAQQKPVLLLILDGMSQAVYRELTEDLLKHNWLEISESKEERSKCLLAALPTVTRVSRCSLLSGLLSDGTASVENKAFSLHPSLKKIASTKFPPLLFHKQDLLQPGSGALAANVRSMIASTEYRILGAVINAIDDQLSSSSQVTVDWSLEKIVLLRHVMEAAREAGRVVIMTSDHGHVLDHDSFYVDSESEGGERYKFNAISLSENEIQLTGDRVVTPNNSVTLPWSEKLRYTKTKNMGYHGGGSLQEVIIPLGIFVSSTDREHLQGWQEIPYFEPDWWCDDIEQYVEESGEKYKTVNKKETKKTKYKKSASERMDDLFGDEFDSTENSDLNKVISSEWVDHLFVCDIYDQMKHRSGRTAIKDEQLKVLLLLLDQNKGQVMEALALRQLVIPKIRLRGFLAGAQKILNIDGYPILTVNRKSQTIKLNINDLKKQFEL